MTSLPPPICLGCARFREQKGPNFFCDAYPEGIPDQIITSQVDHRDPYAGDNGLQFLPQNDEASRYAKILFEPSRG